MLVKLFFPIQLDIMNVCKVSNVSQLVNHQLLVNLSFLIMSVMSLRSTVLANLSKHLMLLKLSVPVMQVILSFVIPLVSPFLILLVIVSQLNLLVNLLMWTGHVLMNNLLIIRTVANMILKNHLVPWIFWWCPYIFMSWFFYFLYFIITFAITMLINFSKAMSGVITFLHISF